MNVKQRLYIGFITMGLLDILNVVVTKFLINKIENDNAQTMNINLPQIKLVFNSIICMEKSMSSLKSYLLSDIEASDLINDVNQNLETVINNMTSLKQFYDNNISTTMLQDINIALENSKKFKVVNQETIDVHTQKINLLKKLKDNTISEEKRLKVEKQLL